MQAETTIVIIKPLVQAKIDYMCKLRSEREWSGNIFFRKKDDGGVMYLTVEDFALMDDFGSTGYTTFNNKDDYAVTYISKHRSLLGCQMGLLHSHHSMYNIGPSGTDDNTMKKEGEAPDTTNFLSIIVYNDRTKSALYPTSGGYSVRITQMTKTNVLAGDKFANEFTEWKNMGQSAVKFKDYEKLEILVINNVQYNEAAWTDKQKEEFEARIKELEEKRKKEEEARKTAYTFRQGGTYYDGYTDDYDDFYGYYNAKGQYVGFGKSKREGNEDGSINDNYFDYYFKRNNEKYPKNTHMVVKKTAGKSEITDTGRINFKQLALMLASLSIMEFDPDPYGVVKHDVKVAMGKTSRKLKLLGDEACVLQLVDDTVKSMLEAIHSALYAFEGNTFEVLLSEAINMLNECATDIFKTKYIKEIIETAELYKKLNL